MCVCVYTDTTENLRQALAPWLSLLVARLNSETRDVGVGSRPVGDSIS